MVADMNHPELRRTPSTQQVLNDANNHLQRARDVLDSKKAQVMCRKVESILPLLILATLEYHEWRKEVVDVCYSLLTLQRSLQLTEKAKATYKMAEELSGPPNYCFEAIPLRGKNIASVSPHIFPSKANKTKKSSHFAKYYCRRS